MEATFSFCKCCWRLVCGLTKDKDTYHLISLIPLPASSSWGALSGLSCCTLLLNLCDSSIFNFWLLLSVITFTFHHSVVLQFSSADRNSPITHTRIPSLYSLLHYSVMSSRGLGERRKVAKVLYLLSEFWACRLCLWVNWAQVAWRHMAQGSGENQCPRNSCFEYR